MFNRFRRVIGFADRPSSEDFGAANDADGRTATAASNDPINVERIGPVCVATLTDSRILDVERIDAIGRQLSHLNDKAIKSVVIDFAQVEFVASGMLTKLVIFRKQCLSDDVELRLCSLAPQIFEVFKLTRLSMIFVVDQDRTASLAELLAPEGFPSPSSDVDWLVCADWWEEQGHESIAQACRKEAYR